MSDANAIPAAHYYRPIAHFNGAVLKYAGMGNMQNLQWVPSQWRTAADPSGRHSLGCVILSEYLGDRIHADTFAPYVGG